jgi:hypothetical protein
MSEDMSLWVQHTVSGFLYIVSGFFLALRCFGIYDFNFLQCARDYLPYLFLGVIALSSIIGYSAQNILEFLIRLIFPKFKYNAIDEVNLTQKLIEPLQKRRHNYYVVLILFRHLVVGTLFLWASLLLWLCSGNINYSCPVSIICLSFTGVFTITYLLHRQSFKEYELAIKNHAA